MKRKLQEASDRIIQQQKLIDERKTSEENYKKKAREAEEKLRNAQLNNAETSRSKNSLRT